MGIPRFSAADLTSIESYHKEFDQKLRELAIPSSVKRVVHLVAMDEDRSVFAPTLVVLDNRSQGTVVDEVWFGGNHGDVGGGWTSQEEVDKEFRRRMITLRFMLEQPHGLDLIEKWKNHPDVRVDPNGTRCGTKHGWGDYSFKTRITGRLPRSIQELPPGAQTPAKVHPTANK